MSGSVVFYLECKCCSLAIAMFTTFEKAKEAWVNHVANGWQGHDYIIYEVPLDVPIEQNEAITYNNKWNYDKNKRKWRYVSDDEDL